MDTVKSFAIIEKRTCILSTEALRLGKYLASLVFSFGLLGCQTQQVVSNSKEDEVFKTVESKLQIENLKKNSRNYITADIYKNDTEQVMMSLRGTMGIAIANLSMKSGRGLLLLHRRKECIPFFNQVSVYIDSEVGTVELSKEFLNKLLDDKSTENISGDLRKVVLEKSSYRLTWLVPINWTKVVKNLAQIELSCPDDYKIK